MLIQWAQSAWNWFMANLNSYPAEAQQWHEKIVNNFAVQHDVQENCTALIW
jgi:hypothetical protein